MLGIIILYTEIVPGGKIREIADKLPKTTPAVGEGNSVQNIQKARPGCSGGLLLRF